MKEDQEDFISISSADGWKLASVYERDGKVEVFERAIACFALRRNGEIVAIDFASGLFDAVEFNAFMTGTDVVAPGETLNDARKELLIGDFKRHREERQREAAQDAARKAKNAA